MSEQIQSNAFRDAAYRSERYRTIGLLSVFLCLAVMSAISAFFTPIAHRGLRYVIFLSFWMCCAALEVLTMLLAHRAQRAQKALPTWFWALSTIFECSLPTIAIFFLSIDKEYIGPYRALLSPPLLVYFFFIILSTLRLRPMLCLLSGGTCAVGYAAVFLWTLHAAPHNEHRNIVPLRTFAIDATILFGAGLVAGAVARQIREHVIAALTEAETRRKLDRIEYDLRTARSIQMGLLPKHPPSIAGYDIAGWSEPADQTGGDFYDWLELPDGRMLFTIADASGHGIGPALLVAACRAYFRAVAMHDDPLEEIAQQVDALVAADIPDGRFITAAICLLAPHEHRLHLYSAGQAPIYLYDSASNSVKIFEADQPPLGTRFGSDGTVARTIHFAPGDALVLVTDGFFECSNQSGEMLGIEPLSDLIHQHRELKSADLIQSLHQKVVSFTQGQPQNDDMTAVVIKRSATG
jgi:serine phosphatase RsbU (regulator of sigma subunit)